MGLTQSIGQNAEDLAKAHLIKHGLIFVERNYSCRMGEIDLIMREGERFVFVEVRSRASSVYGSALDSITPMKQKKIIKTATFYLMTKKLIDKVPLRFDVVTFDGIPPTMNWIKNAFGLDY
jgi:putative endonuclease